MLVERLRQRLAIFAIRTNSLVRLTRQSHRPCRNSFGRAGCCCFSLGNLHTQTMRAQRWTRFWRRLGMVGGKGYTDLEWKPNIGKAVRIHHEPGKPLYRKAEATINYQIGRASCRER